MINSCPFPRPVGEQVRSTPALLYFVWEREAIRIARVNGHAGPWTEDPVLRKYKFTNVRRRDDRVSQWIIKEIIKPNLRDGNLWFSLLIARLINWPPTLDRLIYEEVIPCAPREFNSAAFVKTIEDFKSVKSKVYSGAYMVYPTKMDPGGNKSQAIAKHIIGSVIKHADDINGALWNKSDKANIERFVRTMTKCFGISTFMAGQVAADLTYAAGHLDRAKDLYTFAPIGPGSSRGLNYLLNRSAFATWKQEDFNAELQKLHKEISEQLQITDLTLHDVQNVMCEFSKYCRVVLGEGVPKTTYQPETEF